MTDKDIIYPIIERIVNETYLQRNALVDRDEIAWSLLDDRIARSIIEASLGRTNFTEEQLWEKAGNYVDWLNADITAVFTHSAKWNDGYYTRKRVRRQHPFTRKSREIYALVPNVHTVSNDIGNVLSDTKISETEKAQLIQSRLGQGTFRVALIEYWKGCAVTGCKEIGILRASHIKPWRVCDNLERLDPFNGLLLVPNLDAAFDRGMITFDERGDIIISTFLSKADAKILGIDTILRIQINKRHQKYMEYHRENAFKK